MVISVSDNKFTLIIGLMNVARTINSKHPSKMLKGHINVKLLLTVDVLSDMKTMITIPAATLPPTSSNK